MSQKIIPPPIKWVPLKNYRLANIKKDFQIADFERELANGHVDYIREAIRNNEFYNIMLCVVKGKPYVIIDGQHRLTALLLEHQQNKLKTYNLMLAVYPEEFARNIYRRLNFGKKLKAEDHTRALDDGKSQFFNELQPWAMHQRRADKVSYMDVLHALKYAKRIQQFKRADALNVLQLEPFIKSLTQEDIDLAKLVVSTLRKDYPMTHDSPIYMMAFFRNLFKLAKSHKLNERQISSVAKQLVDRKDLVNLAKARSHHEVVRIYSICEALLV